MAPPGLPARVRVYRARRERFVFLRVGLLQQLALPAATAFRLKFLPPPVPQERTTARRVLSARVRAYLARREHFALVMARLLQLLVLQASIVQAAV